MSDAHGHELTFIQKYVFSQDHKVIGMQYLITGLIMLMIGVFLSYVFRFNLAFPGKISLYLVNLLPKNIMNSLRCTEQ